MRKLSVISLLVLLFLSQVGYYFFYTWQQGQVRAEMRSKIGTDAGENDFKVILLEENAQAINWVEKGREFYLHGVLYDLASVKKQNGKTYLYCLEDEKEHRILKDMARAVRSGSDNAANERDGKHTVKFQLSDYIVLTIDNALPVAGIPGRKYIDNDALICTAFQQVNAPPPRA